MNLMERINNKDSEISESLAQRRSMVFELLNAGLLYDETGKLSNRMRLKVLDMLGFGMWQGSQDITSLHSKKADNENIEMLKGNQMEVSEIDDNDIHINQHIAFMLSNEYEKKIKSKPEIKDLFLNHIREHKMSNQSQKDLENK